jgi:hypothetical protein
LCEKKTALGLGRTGLTAEKASLAAFDELGVILKATFKVMQFCSYKKQQLNEHLDHLDEAVHVF